MTKSHITDPETKLKTLLKVSEDTNNQIEKLFTPYQKKCKFRVLVTPNGYDEGGWLKCIHEDHIYHNASVSVCDSKFCPLLRK